MGITESSVLQQKKFLNEWIITQNINQTHPIWQSRFNPDIELEEYRIYAQAEDDINMIKRLYELRRNSPELINAYYLRSTQGIGLCTGGVEERIYLSLSDLQHVPYPDSLHLMFTCLAGYRKLFRQVGAFKVQEDQVGFTKLGETKVWLDSDFSSFSYKMMESSEYSMVRSIVQLVEDHTDQETMPDGVNSLMGYIFTNEESAQQNEKVTFDQALIKVREFANKYNNGDIPKGMECIRQVGVGSILKSLEGVKRVNHNNKNNNNNSNILNSNVTGYVVNNSNQFARGGDNNSVNYTIQNNLLSTNSPHNNYYSSTLHKTQSLSQLQIHSLSPQPTKPLPPYIAQQQQLSPRNVPIPPSANNPISLPSPNQPRLSFQYSSSSNPTQKISTSVNNLSNQLPTLQRSVSNGQLNGFRPRFSHQVVGHPSQQVQKVRSKILEERLSTNGLVNRQQQKIVVQPLVNSIIPPIHMMNHQQRGSQVIKQSVRTSVQKSMPFRKSFTNNNPPNYANSIIHNPPQSQIYQPASILSQYIPYNNNLIIKNVQPLNSTTITNPPPQFIIHQSAPIVLIQPHHHQHPINLQNPQQLISQPISLPIKISKNPPTQEQQVLTPNKQPIDLLEELLDEVEEGIRVQEVSQQQQRVEDNNNDVGEDDGVDNNAAGKDDNHNNTIDERQIYYQPQDNIIVPQLQQQQQQISENYSQQQSAHPYQTTSEQKALFSQQLIHHNQLLHVQSLQAQQEQQQQQTLIVKGGQNIEEYADVFNSQEEEGEVVVEGRDEIVRADQRYYQEEVDQQDLHHQLDDEINQDLERYLRQDQQQYQSLHQQQLNFKQQQQQQQNLNHQQPQQPTPIQPIPRQSRNMIQSNTISIQLSKVSPVIINQSSHHQNNHFMDQNSNNYYQRIAPTNTPIIQFYKKDSEQYQVESQIQQQQAESQLQQQQQGYGYEEERNQQQYDLHEHEDNYNNQQPANYSIDSVSYKQELYDQESNKQSGVREYQVVNQNNHNHVVHTNSTSINPNHELMAQITQTNDNSNNNNQQNPTISYSFDDYFDRTLSSNKANTNITNVNNTNIHNSNSYQSYTNSYLNNNNPNNLYSNNNSSFQSSSLSSSQYFMTPSNNNDKKSYQRRQQYDYYYQQPKPATITKPLNSSKYSSNKSQVNLQDGKTSSALLQEIRKITSKQQQFNNNKSYYDFSPSGNKDQTFSSSLSRRSSDYDGYNNFNTFNSSNSYSRTSNYDKNIDSYNYQNNYTTTANDNNYNYGQNATFSINENDFSSNRNYNDQKQLNSYNYNTQQQCGHEEQYHVEFDPQILADIQKLAH